MAIITCTDTRLNPIRIFHINVGDAVILRNAGNIITDDILRSLTDAIANGVTEIFLLGHTDCSLSKISPSNLRGIAQGLGGLFNIESMLTALESVKGFTDEKTNVQDQVAKLRSSPIIPSNIPIHGLLFNIIDGDVKVVVNGYKTMKLPAQTPHLGLSMGLPSLSMPSITPKILLSQPTKIADLSSTERQKGGKK